MKAYAIEKSLAESVTDAVRRVMSLEGLVTSAAIAIVNIFGSWVFAVIFLAGLVGYYFTVVRHVGDGHDGLPGPSDAALDLDGMFGLAFRGILCAAIGFLPVILWIATDNARDPLVLLGLTLAGQLYMPAVVLTVTVTNSTWGAVYPVAWIQIIARAPSSYLRFAFVWTCSMVAGFGLWLGVAIVLPPTIIGDYGAGFLWCMFSFAQAVLVGNYLRENASAFGWEAPVSTTAVLPPVAAPVSLGSAAVDPRYPPNRSRRPSRMPSSIPLDEPIDSPLEARPEAVDPRYPPNRPRRPSRMPSSIPLDEPLDAGIAPASTAASIAYAVTMMTVSRVGIDALREDGSRHMLEWSDVVGLVVRQAVVDSPTTFVDVVSGPGATLRLVPWSKLVGIEILGTPQERARAFVQLVRSRNASVKLDAATRVFVDDQGEVPVLPDAATLADYDRRLA